MKAENSAKIQFDSLSANEAFARGAAAAFLARYDPTVPQLADIKTAVSEAVTNCIVHAYPDKIGPITMTAAIYEGGIVRITITDRGVGIPDIAFVERKGFSGEGLNAVQGFGFSVVIVVENNDVVTCRQHLQAGMAADISAAASN